MPMTEPGHRRASLILLLLLLAAGCGSAGGPSRSKAELINPALGPDYSAWLVGAASRIATPEEINEFLTLRDDPQAADFVERFWKHHDPTPGKAVNPLRETFETRSASADRQFSEAGLLGRRSDRGTVYVLYGLPEKIDHEVALVRGGSPVEVWIYGRDAPSGLDGKRPNPAYRFVRKGDATVLYTGAPITRSSPFFLPPSEEPPR